MSVLVKHPDREDVFSLTDLALITSGKSLETIILEELPEWKQVCVHKDYSLRVYWITSDATFTLLGFES